MVESGSGAVKKIMETVSSPQRRVSRCVPSPLLDVDSGTDPAYALQCGRFACYPFPELLFYLGTLESFGGTLSSEGQRSEAFLNSD